MMSNTDIEMKLFTKILNTEQTNLSSVAVSQRDTLYRLIEQNLVPLLNRSSLAGMGEYTKKIKELFEDLDVLLTLPELTGKKTIGIVNYMDSEIIDYLKAAVPLEAWEFIIKDTNIPMVLSYRADDSLYAINDCQHRLSLSSDDFLRVQKLWRDDVDITKLIVAYSYSSGKELGNTAVTYFPRYANLHDDMTSSLMSFQDKVYVFMKDLGKEKDLKSTFIKEWQNDVPLYVVTTNDHETEFSQFFCHQNVTVLNMDGFLKQITPNADFYAMQFVEDALRSIFNNIQFRYDSHITEYDKGVQYLNSDLAGTIDNDKVKELMTKTEARLHAESKKYKEKRQQFKNIQYDILQAAKRLDEVLQDVPQATKMNIVKRRFHYENLWFSISSGQMKVVYNGLKQLRDCQDPYVYIFKMLWTKLQKGTLDLEDIWRLKAEKDNEIVRKAKLFLGQAADFSEHDLTLIAKDINQCETGDELFYLGLWYLKYSDCTEAVKLLKRSYQRGNQEAAQRLCELANRDSQGRLLGWLSDHMIPEANYRMGLGAENAGDNKDEWYFRVAAARGYVPAMVKMLDKYFNKLEHGVDLLHHYKKGGQTIDSLQQGYIDAAKSMCIRILADNPKNEAVNERLGLLYLATDDEVRALDYLSKSDTAEAFYQRGMIYRYTNGDIAQDLEQAKECFKRAKEKGHPDAGKALEALRKKISRDGEREAKHNRYHKDKSYKEESETHKHSDDGWCIITTATCTVLGKGDECGELNTLRRFRDKISEGNPIIQDLVKEYYRVAPLLIEKINGLPEKVDIYTHLWDQYISKTYSHIQSNDLQGAAMIYCQMVIRLCKKYDVKLSEGILEKVKQIHL